MALGALEARLVVLDADDVQPRSREHLGDPGAHRAEPDNTDLAELPGHSRPLAASSLTLESPRRPAAVVTGTATALPPVGSAEGHG
jgi:hypothetical protein